jgi:hypothetical protein
MHNRRMFIFCLVLLGGFLTLTFRLAAEWESKLLVRSEGMVGQRTQAAGEFRAVRNNIPAEKGTSQKIWQAGGAYMAQYNFISFNRDKLGVSFAMSAPEFSAYMAGYGYTDEEMAVLKAWRDKAHPAAWEQGYRSGGKSAAEKAIANVALDYDTKVRKLLLQRGFALRIGNVIECDMPRIVRRSAETLKPLALSFQELATKNRYGAEETVGAVLSMVQTAIRYQIPPMMDGKRHIGGLLPPAKALLSGWGDCDTKTGVAAAILSNWSGMRLVGIAVPGHYLMAIRRIPGKGDMFVRYDGLEYVLVEPAGPAWLEPGSVGSATAALLENSAGYTLEPFF